jgi:epoxyqueuosine reductase
VPSGIAKWDSRQTCQTTCPWNIKYANLLPAGSAFAPREALEGKDARTLARELLGMSQGEFGAAFKGSPMKRAKLRGLKRNAAVVLGNFGSEVDVDVLTRALDDPEPLVREHAAWALDRIRGGVLGVSPAAADADVPELGGDPRTGHAAFGVEFRAPNPR